MKIRFLFLSVVLTCLYSCSQESDVLNSGSKTILSLDNSTRLKSVSPSTFSYLGYGYDVTGLEANAESVGFPVIDVDRLNSDYPSSILDEQSTASSQKYDEQYSSNAVQFLMKITRKVESSAEVSFFKKVLSSSFSSSMSTSDAFDSKYIYGSYNLRMEFRRIRVGSSIEVLKSYLTQVFQDDVATLSPSQLVQKYGTHVLTDINLGAKLNLYFQCQTTNTDRETSARVGVKMGVEKAFSISVADDVDTKLSEQNYARKLYYATYGGDASKGLVGTLSLEQNVSKIDISNWQNSCNLGNSTLVNIGSSGLIPIYELIANETIKQNVKQYIDQYTKTNQPTLFYANVLGLKNGDFVRDVDDQGKVLFLFEGKLRQIESGQTLSGLFNKPSIRNVKNFEVITVCPGASLKMDNGLVNHTSTGKVYLREGNVLRHISSSSVFDTYKFRSKSISNWSSLSGYTIGDPIY